MDRRRFLVSALAGFAAAHASEAHAQSEDAVAFVRNFYTREITRHSAKGRASDSDFMKAFTPATHRIWIASRDNRNPPPVPLGPITHAFFGPGALPGREVNLVNVAAAGGDNIAVDLTISGNPRKLMVRLVRDSGAWRFEDIDYGNGESFVSYHRRRAGL